MEIRRPGLVEWYVNAPAGLEQGFTLERRPVGAGLLIVEIEVLGAEARLDGDTVVLASAAGRRLRYGHPTAHDAAGVAHAARLEVPSASRVRLVIEDARAMYPLVIDPVITGDGVAATQLESDQAGADFGWSVAGAGDVNGDGYADVIVGAPRYDAGDEADGAAFVFLGSPTGIADGDSTTAAAQLTSDRTSFFGWSVAGPGDVNGDGYDDVIVGAFSYPSEGLGAAFVFLGSATGIADGGPATAATQLSTPVFGAFGHSVAGAGDVNGDGYADVIVGAPYFSEGAMNAGAAFVFLGSASGIANGSTASAATRLVSNLAGAWLGWSVAGAGDVNGDGYADAIVGAPYVDAGEFQEGAAFVFLGGASGIASGGPASASARLVSNQATALLGSSVAGAGDVTGDGYADVIVGAPHFDAGEAAEGAALVFTGSASGIADGDPTTAAVRIESNRAGALLGSSVAGAGDVNGDGYADVILGAGEGTSFVFLGSATGIGDGNPTTAVAPFESSGGWIVAGAGDVNGDGYGDVIIGAPTSGSGRTPRGGAFVFL
ncbi:MAG: FG-GAP-like repeat-containing protein, partial [Candidatus Binatia bacterium]